MNKRIKRLNTIGYVLITLQILSFIGRIGQKQEVIADKNELIGYYVGSNFLLIISIILFLRARSLRKKLNNSNQSNASINSIGKSEGTDF
nr:hypothetical protein [uncultured Flavobacterium sp.]